MARRSLLQGDQLNRSQDIEQFEKRLGYRFHTLSHLQEALTHPSRGSATRQDNQRLEFLGDRVLGLVMAQALLERDPKASEGLLAPRYNALVRKETCASVARDIDIGAVLKLGRSEMMSGGRRKDALLADALEAVIAAIYLDGGFEAAQQVIGRWQRRAGRAQDAKRDADHRPDSSSRRAQTSTRVRCRRSSRRDSTKSRAP